MGDTNITDEQRLADFSGKLDSLRPEGFDEEAFGKLKESLITFHKGEVEGLKINSAKMKQEKEALSAKISGFEADISKLNADNKTLSDQLAANQPEELKKLYENNFKQQEDLFNKQKNDLETLVAEQKKTIEDLRRGVLERDVMSEFNKFANQKEWLGGGREIAQSFITGEHGEKFSPLTVDGKTMLVNKDSQSIEQALAKFCETEVGKSLLKSGSSGGGADGSKTSSDGGKKITQAEYDNMSPMDQMNFAIEGGVVI